MTCPLTVACNHTFLSTDTNTKFSLIQNTAYEFKDKGNPNRFTLKSANFHYFCVTKKNCATFLWFAYFNNPLIAFSFSHARNLLSITWLLSTDCNKLKWMLYNHGSKIFRYVPCVHQFNHKTFKFRHTLTFIICSRICLSRMEKKICC